MTLAKGAKAWAGTFDIVSSHNAGRDGSSTLANWRELVGLAGGRPVWSSENPACFALPECTAYSTMHAPVRAGVAGLVSWDTLNSDILVADGSVTAKGLDIAAGVMA